jgi:hypothetical protein
MKWVPPCAGIFVHPRGCFDVGGGGQLWRLENLDLHHPYPPDASCAPNENLHVWGLKILKILQDYPLPPRSWVSFGLELSLPVRNSWLRHFVWTLHIVIYIMNRLCFAQAVDAVEHNSSGMASQRDLFGAMGDAKGDIGGQGDGIVSDNWGLDILGVKGITEGRVWSMRTWQSTCKCYQRYLVIWIRI